MLTVCTALQGLEETSVASVQQALLQASQLAALKSVVMGWLPSMSKAEAEELLGSAGLLGILLKHQEAAADLTRTDHTEKLDKHGTLHGDKTKWLFVAQQQKHSLQEHSIYQQHVQGADEQDAWGQLV